MQLTIKQLDFSIGINSCYQQIMNKMQCMTNIQIDLLNKYQHNISNTDIHLQMIHDVRNTILNLQEMYKDVKEYFIDIKASFIYEYFRKIHILMIYGYNFITQALITNIEKVNHLNSANQKNNTNNTNTNTNNNNNRNNIENTKNTMIINISTDNLNININNNNINNNSNNNSIKRKQNKKLTNINSINNCCTCGKPNNNNNNNNNNNTNNKNNLSYHHNMNNISSTFTQHQSHYYEQHRHYHNSNSNPNSNSNIIPHKREQQSSKYDYKICILQKQQQKLSQQIQTLYDKMLKQKSLIQKTKPSLVIRQLQDMKENIQNVIESTNTVFEESYMIKYFQFKNSLDQIKKPQDVIDYFTSHMNQSLRTKFFDTMSKLILKTKFNENKGKQKKVLIDQQIQTDKCRQRMQPRQGIRIQKNLTLPVKQVSRKANDKAALLQFHHNQKKITLLIQQKQYLKQQLKKTILQKQQLQINYQTLSSLYSKKSYQFQVQQTQKQWKINQKDTQLSKLKTQIKMLKKQQVETFNKYVQICPQMNTISIGTQSNENIHNSQIDNQIIGILKKNNQKLIIKINQKQKKIKQYKQKYEYNINVQQLKRYKKIFIQTVNQLSQIVKFNFISFTNNSTNIMNEQDKQYKSQFKQINQLQSQLPIKQIPIDKHIQSIDMIKQQIQRMKMLITKKSNQRARRSSVKIDKNNPILLSKIILEQKQNHIIHSHHKNHNDNNKNDNHNNHNNNHKDHNDNDNNHNDNNHNRAQQQCKHLNNHNSIQNILKQHNKQQINHMNSNNNSNTHINHEKQYELLSNSSQNRSQYDQLSINNNQHHNQNHNNINNHNNNKQRQRTNTSQSNRQSIFKKYKQPIHNYNNNNHNSNNNHHNENNNNNQQITQSYHSINSHNNNNDSSIQSEQQSQQSFQLNNHKYRNQIHIQTDINSSHMQLIHQFFSSNTKSKSKNKKYSFNINHITQKKLQNLFNLTFNQQQHKKSTSFMNKTFDKGWNQHDQAISSKKLKQLLQQQNNKQFNKNKLQQHNKQNKLKKNTFSSFTPKISLISFNQIQKQNNIFKPDEYLRQFIQTHQPKLQLQKSIEQKQEKQEKQKFKQYQNQMLLKVQSIIIDKKIKNKIFQNSKILESNLSIKKIIKNQYKSLKKYQQKDKNAQKEIQYSIEINYFKKKVQSFKNSPHSLNLKKSMKDTPEIHTQKEEKYERYARNTYSLRKKDKQLINVIQYDKQFFQFYQHFNNQFDKFIRIQQLIQTRQQIQTQTR